MPKRRAKSPCPEGLVKPTRIRHCAQAWLHHFLPASYPDVSLALKIVNLRRFGATHVNRKCFFFFLDSGFAHFLGQLVSIIVKTLRNTNLGASRCFKMKKTSLPVDVRRSKTLLLKLPNLRAEGGKGKTGLDSHFFFFPWSLALRYLSLACHSRFALASGPKTKRLKRYICWSN